MNKHVAAMRFRLVRGRSIDAVDRDGAPPVALINETAARTLWPDGTDPIGRELETNPFLRASDPAIRKLLGMETASDEAVFAEIRRRKDNF